VRRNWLVAATVVGIVAIVIAVLIFRLADGDSGSVETTGWADSVCASLSDWRSSITSLADVSDGALTPESLRVRLAAGETATQELATELKELGPPDLEAGERVEEALGDTTGGLDRGYQSLRQAAEGALDAETPSAFLQALAGLADDYGRLLEQIGDTVAVLQSASLFGESSLELQQAFEAAESCRELREQS